MIRRFNWHFLMLVLVAWSSFEISRMSAQAFTPNRTLDQEEVWQRLQAALAYVGPPTAWRTNPPTALARTVWTRRRALLAEHLADRAKLFYTKYPESAHAAMARQNEYDMIEIAVTCGRTNLANRLEGLERAKLSDLLLDDNERFTLMVRIAELNASLRRSEGQAAVLDEFEKGSRELLRVFPSNPQSWKFLTSVAEQTSDPARARNLANEILSSGAAPELKASARKTLARLAHLGKPVHLRFEALDGRHVDLQKMKGTVVLLHFWDTGCDACAEEPPNLKALYAELHPRGLEILSISFDSSRDDLVRFLETDKLDWPQFFAGPDWDRTFGKDIDVPTLPGLWLVDKKGKLREINTHEGLKTEVEKLLAE